MRRAGALGEPRHAGAAGCDDPVRQVVRGGHDLTGDDEGHLPSLIDLVGQTGSGIPKQTRKNPRERARLKQTGVRLARRTTSAQAEVH